MGTGLEGTCTHLSASPEYIQTLRKNPARPLSAAKILLQTVFRLSFRPMRAVFADCHVGRRPDDDGPFLQALEEAAGRGVRAISLLGDIFHFFIAHPKFETPAIARFLEAVDRLRAAGVAITYVEGNRDFFLRGSYVESRFRQVCDEETFVEGGRRFLLTHGDLLNEEDRPYRLWRAISKNPISRVAIAFLPRKAANRFVWKVEARLYRSNFKHKTRLPVEMIRSFAARRSRPGRRGKQTADTGGAVLPLAEGLPLCAVRLLCCPR